MKRCPQCNRVENDDKLVFCRVDGTVLISGSGSAMSSESATERLPQPITDPGINRAPAATKVLPAQHSQQNKRAPHKRKQRNLIIAMALVVTPPLSVAPFFTHCYRRKLRPSNRLR